MCLIVLSWVIGYVVYMLIRHWVYFCYVEMFCLLCCNSLVVHGAIHNSSQPTFLESFVSWQRPWCAWCWLSSWGCASRLFEVAEVTMFWPCRKRLRPSPFYISVISKWPPINSLKSSICVNVHTFLEVLRDKEKTTRKSQTSQLPCSGGCDRKLEGTSGKGREGVSSAYLYIH